MQMEGIIAKGQLVRCVFMQDAVAASQTDVQLPIAEVNAGAGNAIDEHVMPWAGCVVGVSYSLSAAGTTGTFTIGATINGTEDSSTTLTVGTNQRGYQAFPRDSVRFVAGDRIGAEITTGGTWDGTTADLAVTVWVVVNLEGI